MGSVDLAQYETCKISHFVELEPGSNYEKQKLIQDRYQGGESKVVRIKNLHIAQHFLTFTADFFAGRCTYKQSPSVL